MIANICAFIMCCLAITSKIKTIESTDNVITPIRFFIRTSNDMYLRTLNNLITLNKDPTVIKPSDRKNMLDPDINNIKKYQLNLKSRNKLEKKGLDIKCSFSVFAKSNILDLKNIVEELKNGESSIHNEETVKRLEEEAKILLRTLLYDNLETGKWLWSYFLKIIAIRQYDGNKHFIRANPFKDDQLQADFLDFIRKCIAENYLPPAAMESGFVRENISVYPKMFSDLRQSDWVKQYALNNRSFFTVEFLYLKPFWDDENQLLFRQLTDVIVDWSVPKQRHEAEVVITREFVESRTWIYKPYGRLDHQHLLIKIIDARIYCYISVILYVYEKQLSILNVHALQVIKDLMYEVILSAMKMTAYKDEFLVVILSELQLEKISNIDDVKDILGRTRTKANEILNDLNDASTTGIDRFSFNVGERQLSDNGLIVRIINEFGDYLEQFKRFLPFRYKRILHFMDVVKTSTDPYI